MVLSFDPEVHDVIAKNVQEHIEGIPTLLSEIFPQMQKIWKFSD